MLNLKKEYSDGEIAGKTDLEILDDLDALQRDPATAELIRSGRTIGCFYIESPSMRSLFQRMRCECYEDVVAASSIIRPGVAESGMMNEYVKRRRAMRGERPEARSDKILDFRFGILDCKSGGEKPEAKNRTGGQPVPHSQSSIQNLKSKIQNSFPRLAELLAETYGVMVYQEDVIKVVHELGGLSLDEADILRRAMAGKTDGRKAMKSLTERFFAGCRARGVPEPAIAELWRQIETFASYAFCKGHSAAFAVLSYQVAYLKAHYPAEFMAAVLSNGGGFYGAAAYIQECRRMGLRVLGPDVNESDVEYRGKTQKNFRFWILDFRLENGGGGNKRQDAKGPRREARQVANLCPIPNPKSKIENPKSEIGWVRVGFAAIKNFPLDLAQRIVRVRRKRRFDGLEDFLRRLRPGHEAVEKLIRVGAFDRFGIPRERLSLELDIYFREQRENWDMSLKV